MRAVVVDLPLVPVIPTTLCFGRVARARANSSMSPISGTPASWARAAIGCRFRGTPGDTTIPSKPSIEVTRGSASRTPMA